MSHCFSFCFIILTLKLERITQYQICILINSTQSVCLVNANIVISLSILIGSGLRFCGMTDEESAPILNYLFRHQIKAEFTCRFHWQPGSIAFWDNRATQHNPVNDYHGYKRVMHRITLAGDQPH